MFRKQNSLKYWKITVDVVTLFWVIYFVIDNLTELLDPKASSYFTLGITAFFIVDLAIIFWKYESKKRFFKENWLDVLMLLPLFRLFRFVKIMKFKRLTRLFKILRKSKKLKRGSKLASDSFDLGKQIHDRIRK